MRYHHRFPARIAILYAILATVWIVFSDYVLLLLVPNVDRMAELQSFKGILFVIVMGLLLYVVLRREAVAHARSIVALRGSEELYRALYEDSGSVILLIDPALQRIVDANPAACGYYGYTRDQLRTMPIAALVSERLPGASQPDDPGGTRAAYPQHGLFRHRLADGHLREVEVHSGNIQVAGQELLYAIVHDVTDRRRAEEALRRSSVRLRQLSRKLVAVQEAERRSIARELHDEIGQMLTGLNLTLEISMHSAPEKLAARLAEAQALVNDLIGRVRRLSLDLRPSMLDDLGLLPTVQWYTGRYSQQTGVQVAVEHEPIDRPIPPEVAIAAYRFIQEALTNVVRHAGVDQATVRLWARDDWLYAQVIDRGQGFDVETALAAKRSSGLAGMRERALLLGGRMTIESAPGSGTRLAVEWPLDLPDADQRAHLW